MARGLDAALLSRTAGECARVASLTLLRTENQSVHKRNPRDKWMRLPPPRALRRGVEPRPNCYAYALAGGTPGESGAGSVFLRRRGEEAAHLVS